MGQLESKVSDFPALPTPSKDSGWVPTPGGMLMGTLGPGYGRSSVGTVPTRFHRLPHYTKGENVVRPRA